jgi:predicted RNA-binding protein with TRAM domain
MLRRINPPTRVLVALICLLATFACGAGAAMALSVSRGESYWLVSSSGQVFAFGNARNYGSEAGKHFRGQIVGIVSTPNGKGYWLVSSIGHQFSFGDAHLYKYKGTKLQKLTGHVSVKDLRGRIVGVAIAKLTVATPATVVTAAPPPGAASPTITTSSLGEAAENVPYSSTLAATGGGGTSYNWALITGALPTGLQLNSGGVISGTPTTSGSFPIAVTVTGHDGGTATSDYTLTVTPPVPPTVTTTTLPYPVENLAYSTTLTATGGYAPYLWTLASGSTLPAGLTLTSGGTLSGTATTPGTYTFTVTVTGADAGAASITYLLLVATPTESYNWSGYVETTTGSFTSASGTFTVPTLTAGDAADTAMAEWVGIDGNTNSDLIQAGVEDDPSDGLSAWWEILPATETPISEPVDPGDQISVSISEVGTACSSNSADDPVSSGVDWDVTITDTTQGWSDPVPLCYDGPGSSAEWVVEAPEEQVTQHHETVDEIVPLAAFNGNITFSSLATSTTASALTYMTIWQHAGTPIVCTDSGCTAPTDPTQTDTPSVLDSTGFNVAYGVTAPAAP